MRHILIKQISDTLKAMEPGKFQDFCLVFLPLYDINYKGLKRHGGTAEGKTRPGVPDLIKTRGNGKQVAVACGTEEGYWQIPKDVEEMHKCKPCRDIDECLKKLTNLSEIVLCSNREIPTNMADVTSLIIEYAVKKTSVKITQLSCADFETALIDNVQNVSFEKLFKTFMPQVYENITMQIESQRNKLAMELVQERNVDPGKALEIAEETVKCIAGFGDAKEFALAIVDELKSKYERVTLPPVGLVARQTINIPLFMNPIGQITTLLGLPKIGKTTLVAQCAQSWITGDIDVRWFDCPIDQGEQHVCIKEFFKSILLCYVAPAKASKLAHCYFNNRIIQINTIKYKLDRPCVFVIDNAQFLDDSPLKILCNALNMFKQVNIFDNIGVVFISNKKLKYIGTAISNEIVAPLWAEEELKQFLVDCLPEKKYFLDPKYFTTLFNMSLGHPLLALALVNKFQTEKDLAMTIFSKPALAAEDLTAELKALLFDDILYDDIDSLNYVLRLSQLITKAKTKVIHALKNKVNPPINTPFNIVLQKLYGSVIEGDKEYGYYVSPIYRDIAKDKLSTEEKREIYDIISTELLTPQKKILNLDETSEGIFYAILAEQLEKAYYWTATLIHTTVQSDLTEVQVHAVVDRLTLLAYLTPPQDPEILMMYNTALFGLGVLYAKICENKKAFELFDKIVKYSGVCSDEKIADHLEFIANSAEMYKTTFIAPYEPERAVTILSEVDIVTVKEYPFIGNKLNDMIAELISNKSVSIRNIPKILFTNLISITKSDDETAMGTLIRAALHLGVKAHLEDLNVEEATNLIPADSSMYEILKLIIECEFFLEKKDFRKTLNLVENIINLCKEQNIWGNTMEGVIRQVEGDTYYGLRENNRARTSYQRSLECIDADTVSFENAWANYKLGLLSDNPTEAEKYFKKSSDVFKVMHFDNLFSRSEGERGVALLQLHKPLEFMEIANSLLSEYYIEEQTKYAPVVTILLSHLGRLKYELTESPMPEIPQSGSEEMITADFERGVYAGVLDIAKPQLSGLSVYYWLGKCYALLENFRLATGAFQIALSFDIKDSFDTTAVPLIVRESLNVLIPKGDLIEIKKLMIVGLSIETDYVDVSPGSDPRGFISFCIFSKLDSVIPTMTEDQKKEYIKLLDAVGEEIGNTSIVHKNWFLAEIQLRKARIGENIFERRSQKQTLWQNSYNSGIRAKNNNVILASGHYIAFIYYENSPMKSLAEIQFNILNAITWSKGNQEGLIKLGHNLFNFWRKIDWRRLSVGDLKAKVTLLESAKILEKESIPAEHAALIMVLLLAGLYNLENDKTKSITDKITELKIESKIPEEVKKKLTNYLKQMA